MARSKKNLIATLRVNEQLSLEEQIAQRAHELWKERGSDHGSDWSDWFRAESEITEWHHRQQSGQQPNGARPSGGR